MSSLSYPPIFRQIAWVSLIPQIAILFGLYSICERLNAPDMFFPAALILVACMLFIRRVVAKNHRAGILAVTEQKFTDAVQSFEASYGFFSRYSWVDVFRAITLFSSSRMSYREMALVNIAFCYGQLGQGKKAREYYEKTLAGFPESGMAKAGLRLLDSAGD